MLAVGLATVWLVVGPPTPDLAAQDFREWLFEREGFTLFQLQWYGGHATPGYSLLFPPLAAVLGAEVVGALAAVSSTACFAALARRHWGERARAGVMVLAVAAVAELVLGRLTFALGTAIALAALLALQRGRPVLAVLLGVATTAASPVAGVFLAMAALAVALGELWSTGDRKSSTADGAARWRGATALGVAAAALGSAVVLAVLFPTGGEQSWGSTSFAVTLACAALVFAALPRHERTLRTGVALYAAGCVAAFVLSTPMGSNATRPAALLGAALVVGALGAQGRRWGAVVSAAVPLAVFTLWGPVREVRKVDASAERSYYAPLIAALERAGATPASRVEVPFTRMHWEASHLAKRFPLARGWEAQVDRDRNGLFYDRDGTPLSEAEYTRWLTDNAVRFVALPDVVLDPAGFSEGALLERGVAGLDEVWRNERWRLYERAGARDVANQMTPTSFTVTRAGTYRVRHTRHWRGRARITRAPGGWTRVEPDGPGPVRIEAGG